MLLTALRVEVLKLEIDGVMHSNEVNLEKKGRWKTCQSQAETFVPSFVVCLGYNAKYEVEGLEVACVDDFMVMEVCVTVTIMASDTL